MKGKIANNGDWYLVQIIERCEPTNIDKSKPLRRCTVWGNYHLIRASSPEKAYEKAEKYGKEGTYTFKNSDKLEMKWEYLGIGDLLPIYEDIEDKAEIMWADYGFISAKRSERIIMTKEEILKNIKPKKK
jgi:hypothetical protein